MSDYTPDVEIIECTQLDETWREARAGVITASMAHEVRKVSGGLDEKQSAYVELVRSGLTAAQAAKDAGYQKAPTSDRIKRALDGEKVGDYTEAAKNYAMRLAIERISGQLLAEYQFETYAMRRGKELEPDARAAHSARINKDVTECGIVRTKDGKFGASADGDFPKGGAEYKCFISPEKLRPILLEGEADPAAVDQSNMGMWLHPDQKEFWDLCLYCPALASISKDLIVDRHWRNDDYITDMTADLVAFDNLVEEYRDRIKGAKTWINSQVKA